MMLLWDSHFWLSAQPFLDCGGLVYPVYPELRGEPRSAAAFSVAAAPRRIRRSTAYWTSVQARTTISWRVIPAVHPRLGLSFVLSHRISAVGTPPVALARSNGFSWAWCSMKCLLTRRPAA